MIPIHPGTSMSPWRARGTALALALVVVAMLALTLGAGVANAATFTVTTTSDPGDGSLRDALEDANNNTNPTEQDAIGFDIPPTDTGCDAGSGVCTISPTSALPEISEPVIVDGYTQEGASANTLATGNNAQLKIELNGGSADGDGIRVTAPDCVIKGLIINLWAGSGVFILEEEASGNIIEGNFIGTDPSGSGELGNGNRGVTIGGASDNVVGGTSPAARNLISGNDNEGVEVVDSSASGNAIQGNYIGTDASGTQDLGNFDEGVFIVDGSNNIVGGTSAAAANTIAFNGGDGVDANEDSATGNSILRNSIYSNVELGIDLDGGDENPLDVTANDPQDPDPGSNNLQNFPVITSATTPNGRSVAVQGTLNSNPNESFTIQLFSNPTRDPSGFGEGKTFLGQTNVTANAGGNAAFSFSANAPVAAGEFVTATATNAQSGDTSEFSRAVGVKDETSPTVISTNPTNRATGVPPRADVFATFSEAMNPATINTNTFKLFIEEGSGQTLVPAKVTYNEAARRGRLNPDANLIPGATYVATVTTRARDLAGNPLAERKNWRFTVAR